MSHSNSSICQGSSRSCGRPDRPRTSLPCKCSASLTSGNYRLYYTMAGLRKSKGHQMDRRTFVYASLSSLLTYNCTIAHARANLHGCRMAAKAVESLGYKLIEPPSPATIATSWNSVSVITPVLLGINPLVNLVFGITRSGRTNGYFGWELAFFF
jgi:hypothetical protein